jgi:MFS family permease
MAGCSGDPASRWRGSGYLRRDCHPDCLRSYARDGAFQFAQGLVVLSVGVGAGLSNFISGFVVQYFGYPAAFLFLAAIALAALIFFALMMPETRGYGENVRSADEGRTILSNASA